MKKIVTVTEVEGEGLEAFLGKKILIIAQSYFYSGTLTGINSSCVLLEDALFVLETGDFAKAGFDYAEKIPGGKCYVQKSAIEAFFEAK
jgi:hypothetical protein